MLVYVSLNSVLSFNIYLIFCTLSSILFYFFGSLPIFITSVTYSDNVKVLYFFYFFIFHNQLHFFSFFGVPRLFIIYDSLIFFVLFFFIYSRLSFLTIHVCLFHFKCLTSASVLHFSFLLMQFQFLNKIYFFSIFVFPCLFNTCFSFSLFNLYPPFQASVFSPMP